MAAIIKEFKKLFRYFEDNDDDEEDLINIYLVFMGIRSACLIHNINIFYSIPPEANLEIHYGLYPEIKKGIDYPLVCIKNSWVSRDIKQYNELTDEQIGLYIGFNCFDHDWKNPKIVRHEIKYIKNNNPFYVEVCSSALDPSTKLRIKFKAKEMSNALKMINNKYKVRFQINKIPILVKKRNNN